MDRLDAFNRASFTSRIQYLSLIKLEVPMTDLMNTNFELTLKFNDKFQVSVAPGGLGIDLHDSEGNWVTSFDDLHEVESELLS